MGSFEMKNKQDILTKIAANIEGHGFHITLVTGSVVPRYLYTIGLSQHVGYELIFAGGLFYSDNDAQKLISLCANTLLSQKKLNLDIPLTLPEGEECRLVKVEDSWAQAMALGVADYYRDSSIPILQVLPPLSKMTLDVPNLSQPWSKEPQPVWTWIFKEWPYDINENALAITNLDALQGYPVTEVMRWETNLWEMFSGPGPDVEEHEIRKVPLAVMLGIDSSLLVTQKLGLEKGVWRESSDDKWHDWG